MNRYIQAFVDNLLNFKLISEQAVHELQNAETKLCFLRVNKVKGLMANVFHCM